jgi:hypothetical protein
LGRCILPGGLLPLLDEEQQQDQRDPVQQRGGQAVGGQAGSKQRGSQRRAERPPNRLEGVVARHQRGAHVGRHLGHQGDGRHQGELEREVEQDQTLLRSQCPAGSG